MYDQTFLHQKQYSLILRKESLDIRFEHLDKLEQMIRENSEDIIQALNKDFAKPSAETLLTEIYPLLSEIKDAKKNLKKWARPTKVPTPLVLFGSKSAIRREPRGVCLIISPWNYPFQLTIAPLIGAIAAGNCVFLKPSELSRHTSALLKRLIGKYFTEEHVCLYEGGPEVTTELLKLPFDHVFFTGSTRVGKIVSEAASKNLSSVTLELGGKSPTIVDSTANIDQAAEKIAWGKFLNAGQTCVAPDYVLVQDSIYEEFKKILVEKIDLFYGKNKDAKKQSSSYARLISSGHTERLERLLKNAVEQKAEIFYGGEVDIKASYVAPTLIEKLDLHSELMKEEIFGPILPLLPFKDLKEAIHFVNDRPKPLALYIFSASKMNIKDILKETSSGGVCINNTMVHVGSSHFPFGGVGESGTGNYHGYFGFRAFSHEKAILRQYGFGALMRMTYPPYTQKTINLLRRLIHWNL